MSEDERLIRNDPAIREIAQMVTNYCASCVELEARATAAEAGNARLRDALTRQGDNMAFLLNHVAVPVWWYDKFTRELADTAAILAEHTRAKAMDDLIAGDADLLYDSPKGE